jgi:protein RecA
MVMRIPKGSKAKTLTSEANLSPFRKHLLDIGYLSLTSPHVTLKVRKCLPTVLTSLNVIAARDVDGVYGLPFGRQMEFAGKPDSGKTTLLITIAAAAQKLGHTVVWVETEHSLNSRRAGTLGVNIDQLYIDTPDCLEEAITRMIKAIYAMPKFEESGYDNDHGLVICFDSIAATPTQAELEGEITDTHVAVFARQMAKFQRKIVTAIGKRNVMIVYSNQLKDNIGFGYKKYQTYGGNAIRYHCALRFETTYTGKIKGKNEVKGITINIENVKNKCLIPYKKIEGLEFDFKNGFDDAQNLILALELKNLLIRERKDYKLLPISKDTVYSHLELTNMLKKEDFRKKMIECINASL